MKIRIIFPSRAPRSREHVEVVRKAIAEYGFEVICNLDKVVDTAAVPFGIYSNSTTARANDLMDAIESDADVIWAFAGGAGAVEVVDRIEAIGYQPASNIKPKILIGYSDITNLHSLWAKWGWVSWHGLCAGLCTETFPFTNSEMNRKSSIKTVLDIIAGKQTEIKYDFQVIANGYDNLISLKTEIFGGNAFVLTGVQGSNTRFDLKGRILFLENIFQDASDVMRSLTSLIRNGTFNGVLAIIFGDLGLGNEQNLEVIKLFIEDHLNPHDIKVPILYSPNFGHADYNYTLPFGLGCTLSIEKDRANIEF